MTIARHLPSLFFLAVVALPVGAAFADDLKPMDPNGGVDPELLKAFYGPWVISNQAGDKTCKVDLKDEPTIGGSVIDVDPGCAKVFPVMDNIAAWRLMEGWGIDLVDATKKTVIRFTTPDAEYVADPEIDGIFTIVQPGAE
jgi:hypothetical protein